ncbi:MAG: hypothetical protein GY780_04805 [bacterium]|nr:hypothetical protein [bacterium]
MSDPQFNEDENEKPIAELKDFTLSDDQELPGRVNRSLNRHLLVGDSLHFSLDIFQKIIWEYTKNLVEIWPTSNKDKTE